MSYTFNQDPYVDVLNQALTCKRNGNYETSIELTIQAIHIDPHRDIAYYNLGKLLHITGKYSESVKSYQKAIEFSWDANQALLHLGHSLVAQDLKKEKDRILHLKYRITIDPYLARRLTSHDSYKLKKKITEKDFSQYENNCVVVAAEYMNSQIGK